jgi:hypothetical protein
VIFMKKSKRKEKLRMSINADQKRYKKLRSDAHRQLEILEEYFGLNSLNKEMVYQQILFHLNSSQKEISYFGLRGVIVSVVAAIFTFGFNSMIIPELLNIIEKNKVAGLIFTMILTVVFVGMFLLTVQEPFSLDRKRRNQLYINEYIIEIVKDRIKNL